MVGVMGYRSGRSLGVVGYRGGGGQGWGYRG